MSAQEKQEKSNKTSEHSCAAPHKVMRLGKFSFTRKTPGMKQQMMRRGLNNVNLISEWNKIIDTINESEKYPNNVETFILCSLNSVSAFYLNDLYDFVAEQNWKKLTVDKIILGRVHQPNYLNPQVLDDARKHIIKEKLESVILRHPACKDTLESNLNWILGTSNTATIDDTLNYVTKILKIRNLNENIIVDFLEAKK